MKTGNRLLILSFLLGIFLLFVTIKNLSPIASVNPQETIVNNSTLIENTSSIPLPSSTFLPESTQTPSAAYFCNLKFSSDVDEKGSTFTADKTMLLSDVYTKTYGTPRDNYDLYAVAYFNNRKALEEKKYNAIDPYYLSVESNWVIFLPPIGWINAYRNFPLPVLYPVNLDDTNLKISISGTSILHPLSLQISNCFEYLTNFKVSLQSNNTITGLFDYCRGVSDIFGVSLEDLTSRCQGVKLINFEVARYVVVIFTNSSNPYADQLIASPPNEDELRKLLFSARLWSDVRNSWNNEPIIRYFPFTSSGEFETVRNNVFPLWDTNSGIPNLNQIEDNNLLIDQVIKDNYSIGIIGFDDYQTNREVLRAMPVNKISPSLDTIEGNKPSYPLTRQLYLYTGETLYNQSPLIRYFINFYLTYEFDFIEKLGYFKPIQKNFLDNPNTFP